MAESCRCDFPHYDEKPGTVWRCDRCGHYWKARELGGGHVRHTAWVSAFWPNLRAKLTG